MAVISFNLFWQDHGAEKGSKQLAENFDKTGKNADKMREQTKMAAAGAALAIGLFAKKSIETASDVSESQSKIGVVFGKSAQSVLDFGKTSATSLGISKAAAYEAAGTFGNLFVSLKLPQSEAAKMSTKMVTLAADMASFNNASPEEALEAIRSGLVGETEPLRRFGVNMNDATLKAEAMKLGLIDNTKEALAPAVKAQAAYSLMLSQTGTAQGDFARTSNGLANQQRILAARFSDLQAELGAKLLPAVNKTMAGILDLMDAFDENKDIVVPLAAALGTLAATVWTVNKAAAAAKATEAAWTTVMTLNTIAAGKNAAAVATLTKNAKIAGGVFAVVGTAAGAVWAGDKLGKWEVAEVNVKAMTKALEANRGQAKLTGQEIQLMSDKGILGLGKDSLTSADALERFGDSAYNALDKGWDARLGRWQSFGSAQSKFKEQVTQLDDVFAQMVEDGNIGQAYNQMRLYEGAATKAGVPLASLRENFPKFNAAVKASTPPTKSATKAVEDHSAALKEDSKELVTNAQNTLKLRGDQTQFEEAVDASTQALKDNGKTLNIHTEKGRANRDALDQIAIATLQWRTEAQKAGRSIKEQTRITQDGRAELVKMGQRFGMTKKAAKAYADEVLGIPKRVATTIKLSLINGIPRTIMGVRVGGIPGSRQGGTTLGFRDGGAVFGAGTSTSDSIPALLSNDEHVLTAREVKAMGGHKAVEDMRKRAVQGYAKGGAVFGGPGLTRALEEIAGGTGQRLAKAIEKTAQAAIGFNPSLNGALNFARAQIGKPYVWGGVGPRGYDCSGAMSALLNVVQGRNPYSRRGTSASFPWADFAPGPGSFMVGAFSGLPGHMAGTINGVNVESAGGVGFRMGKSARGARNPMFTRVGHLRGYKLGGPVNSPVGDAPFDLLDPGGERYVGDALRRMFLADQGGMIRSGDLAINRSGAAERMLSPRQTRSFDSLVRVLERPSFGAAAASTGPGIDYPRLGDHVARAIVRAGVSVKMDGRVIGTLLGSNADLLGRTS